MNSRTDQQQAMPAHAKALRAGRYSQPGQIYLVTTVVKDRTPIFSDWRIGRALVQVLRAADQAQFCQTLAYVVMPDHLHWLLSLGSVKSLSALLQQVKGQSSRSIGVLSGMSGSIWQQGFYDHAARSDEDIKALARYVICNPVRAGLVVRPGDYPLWDAIYI